MRGRDPQIGKYVAAWNEHDPERRRDLLAASVTPDVELIHPTFGISVGVDSLSEHIDTYQAAMPSTEVVLASAVDGHNQIARYQWQIVDADGAARMSGLDVVEVADDGRLTRILLFHGDSAPVRHVASG